MSLKSWQLALEQVTATPDNMSDVYPDPCPECFGEMTLGDFVCWGICYECLDKAEKSALADQD